MLAAAITAPKITFDTFAMISFSAMFIDTQKNGLHRRKFHHSILSTMQQSCIACEARRIAANIAKLPELLCRW